MPLAEKATQLCLQVCFFIVSLVKCFDNVSHDTEHMEVVGLGVVS